MILVDGITTHETPLRYKQWSHMISTTGLTELHAMADRIGLKRSWFQNGSFAHYDVTPSKRALAIQFGAREASGRAIVFCNFDYANRRKVRPCDACIASAEHAGQSVAAGSYAPGCVRCDLSIYLAPLGIVWPIPRSP